MKRTKTELLGEKKLAALDPFCAKTHEDGWGFRLSETTRGGTRCPREKFGGRGGDVPAVIGAPMHGKVVKDRITSHPEKKLF